MKYGTLVLVQWADSASQANSLQWHRGAELQEALETDEGSLLCHSVGYVVHKSRRCLTLAANITDAGLVSHVIHIPTGAIVWTKRLIEPEK